MLKVFSGSCLSLDDMDVIRRPKIIEQPHLLGPGNDFFTEDGRPVRPQPSAHTLQKVFSGSALDLNAMKDDEEDDEFSAAVAEPSDVAAADSQQSASGATVTTILSQLSCESERERSKALKNKTTVLVVGGNGYVACHVVAKLLDAGYSVRITVSEPLDSAEQLEIYSTVPDAGHRLSITEASVTNPGAFREVLRGCKYVVHCGVSPAQAQREKDIIRAHLESVAALFDAIRLNGKPSVKRVVLTGSAAAVFHIQDPVPPSGVFNEQMWNTRATAISDPVPFAKLSFEREAWRLQKMFGVELVVMLPSIVIGPSLLHETSEAMRTIHDLASGSPYFPFAPNLYWNFVDVRDVAEAHVRAMEHPDISEQRIIVSTDCLSLSEIGALIKKSHPHLSPPTYSAPSWITLIVAPLSHAKVKMAFLWRNLGVKKVLDNRKCLELLDMQMTPLERTIADSVEQLIRAGHLPPPPAAGPARGEGAAVAQPKKSMYLAAVAVALGAIATVALLRPRGKR
eukprot:CAMPEP_0176424174 /NCGR_PEP_ID=MMETSP0127-20121128/10693_1 /TAXON_ID=938130 /ORGANISM="Platyophrya macrostoma, Strain WH" /LENGTH=510 /DNA_ID=CAMNT_0017805207 /DNA_START=79 /DNA_END=1611 /DNA_ORIENTATION=-